MSNDVLERLRALGMRYALDASALATAIEALERGSAEELKALRRVATVARQVVQGKADAKALSRALEKIPK